MLRSAQLTANTARNLVTASSSPRQVLIGPAVRLLLQDYQIDPKQLEASGPKGNILKSDVLAHISHSKLKPTPSKSQPKQDPATASKSTTPIGSTKRHVRQKYEDIPLKGDKHARNITEAHYSLTSELEVDNLLNELKKFDSDANDPDSQHNVFNKFMQRASAEACRRVPEAHIQIDPYVSVSQNIVELERNEGRLHSHEFQVSNLSKFDSVDHFTPVGQPNSETYTLAVGRARKRVVLGTDGIRQVTTIKVTLSCDHRAVDHTLGAQWFKHFKQFMEHPNSIHL